MKIRFVLVLGFALLGAIALAAAPPAIQKVAISPDRAFLVNGKPYFPLMAWLQDPKNFAAVVECGMNTTAGYFQGAGGTKNVAEYLERVREAGLYGVMPFDPALKNNSALLAYIQDDEPDLKRKGGDKKSAQKETNATPEEVVKRYQAIKSADPSRPVFMTLTAGFLPFFNDWPATRREAMYPAYIKGADVVGYDIYPIYGWNKPEWIYLGHDATELLARLAAPRPVYAWIETSKGGQWTGPLERQKEVTPAQIRAEVWMAICRGATAIGYFTHVWKPSYNQFGVPEENRRALREINEQITRLAPAILAPPVAGVSIASEDGVKVNVKATRLSGSGEADGIYFFAVNYDERIKAAKATIKFPELTAGSKVEVIGESRAIQSGKDQFTDNFAPLAVHIYKVR